MKRKSNDILITPCQRSEGLRSLQEIKEMIYHRNRKEMLETSLAFSLVQRKQNRLKLKITACNKIEISEIRNESKCVKVIQMQKHN